MNTTKIETRFDIPSNYTGITELPSGTKVWYKNGLLHREDGPSFIYYNGDKEWWLAGKYIWDSAWNKLYLRTKIVCSKEQYREYPALRILTYIDEDGIKEQIIIPGMEEYIIE